MNFGYVTLRLRLRYGKFIIILFATLSLNSLAKFHGLLSFGQQRPAECCWIKRNSVYNCTVILLREAELTSKRTTSVGGLLFPENFHLGWSAKNVSIMFRPERSEILAYSWKARMVLLFKWNHFKNVFMLNLKRKCNWHPNVHVCVRKSAFNCIPGKNLTPYVILDFK